MNFLTFLAFLNLATLCLTEELTDDDTKPHSKGPGEKCRIGVDYKECKVGNVCEPPTSTRKVTFAFGTCKPKPNTDSDDDTIPHSKGLGEKCRIGVNYKECQVGDVCQPPPSKSNLCFKFGTCKSKTSIDSDDDIKPRSKGRGEKCRIGADYKDCKVGNFCNPPMSTLKLCFRFGTCFPIGPIVSR